MNWVLVCVCLLVFNLDLRVLLSDLDATLVRLCRNIAILGSWWLLIWMRRHLFGVHLARCSELPTGRICLWTLWCDRPTCRVSVLTPPCDRFRSRLKNSLLNLGR